MSGTITECELPSTAIIVADVNLSISSLTSSFDGLPNVDNVSFDIPTSTLSVPWFTPAFNIDLTKLDGFRLSD